MADWVSMKRQSGTILGSNDQAIPYKAGASSLVHNIHKVQAIYVRAENVGCCMYEPASSWSRLPPGRAGMPHVAFWIDPVHMCSSCNDCSCAGQSMVSISLPGYLQHSA